MTKDYGRNHSAERVGQDMRIDMSAGSSTYLLLLLGVQTESSVRLE